NEKAKTKNPTQWRKKISNHHIIIYLNRFTIQHTNNRYAKPQKGSTSKNELERGGVGGGLRRRCRIHRQKSEGGGTAITSEAAAGRFVSSPSSPYVALNYFPSLAGFASLH
ncbi:unnamed protein product, partial [Musa hybrid cultivar]